MCEHMRARLLQGPESKRRRLSQQTYPGIGTDTAEFLRSDCPECANAQQSSSVPQAPPSAQCQESEPANTSTPPPDLPHNLGKVDNADTELSAPPRNAPRRHGVLKRVCEFIRAGKRSRSNSHSKSRTSQQPKTGLSGVALSLADLSGLDADGGRGQGSPQIHTRTAPSEAAEVIQSAPLPVAFPGSAPGPAPVPLTGGPPPPPVLPSTSPQPQQPPPLLLERPHTPAPSTPGRPRGSRPANRPTTRVHDDHNRIVDCKALMEHFSAEYGRDQPGGYQDGDGHTLVTTRLEPALECPEIEVVLCARLGGSDSDSESDNGGGEEKEKLIPMHGNLKLKRKLDELAKSGISDEKTLDGVVWRFCLSKFSPLLPSLHFYY